MPADCDSESRSGPSHAGRRHASTPVRSSGASASRDATSATGSSFGLHRVCFAEQIGPDEVAFEDGVFLLTKAKAQRPSVTPVPTPQPPGGPQPPAAGGETPPVAPGGPTPPPVRPAARALHLRGDIPPELWNRLGTKLLPKLRGGSDLRVGVEFSVTLPPETAGSVEQELRQALRDLGLEGRITIE